MYVICLIVHSIRKISVNTPHICYIYGIVMQYLQCYIENISQQTHPMLSILILHNIYHVAINYYTITGSLSAYWYIFNGIPGFVQSIYQYNSSKQHIFQSSARQTSI